MITPIIMESDIEVVKSKLGKLSELGEKRVHIDIGDGFFSDLLTIAPADLQQFDLSRFAMDIHLLVDDPSEWIEECVALKPSRLIGQVEHMGSQGFFVDTVDSYGVKAGLALKVETPIEEIESEILSKCSVILLLAVPAGTSGSPFDDRVLEKIKKLRSKYSGFILIDGGVNDETYKRVIAAGANEAGENSAYWDNKV